MPDEPTPWFSDRPPPGHGTQGDRAWAIASHLGLTIAVPLAVVLGRGHRSAYVCHQAVEALNFQITVVLALLVCSLLAVVPAGLLLLPVVVLAAAAFAVQAALAAGRGAWHRYPLTVRFLS